jgi:hypothetical protein
VTGLRRKAIAARFAFGLQGLAGAASFTWFSSFPVVGDSLSDSGNV